MSLDSETTGHTGYVLTISEIAHIKVSGDLEGDFVVTEERGANEFVIVREPEPSWKEVQSRVGAREMTPKEFEAFMAEHGPHMLPPDGEGLGGHAARRMSASSLARGQSTPNQHCDLLLAATFVATPEHLRP